MAYPWGDPDGTRWQRLAWKLGWRLVPTREERWAGAGLMVVGVIIIIIGLLAIL